MALGGDLTNFPLLVVISNDTDLQSYASNNGHDIVFTLAASTNKLDHEIEYFSNGTVIAWVKIPCYSAAFEQSNILYMYFDKTKAGNQQNTSAVWSEDYLMVHHFKENSGTFNDSTANGFNGTWNYTSGTSTRDANGLIGRGVYFDGTNDYISLITAAVPTNKSFTMSLWQKSEIPDTEAVARYTFYSNTFYFKKFQAANPRQYHFYLLDGSGVLQGTAYNIPAGTEHEWVRHTAVYNHDEYKFYVYASGNVVLVRDCTNTSQTAIIRISHTGNNGWIGFLDEAVISTNGRSSNWITTEYSNQINPLSFRTIGSISEYGVPAVTVSALSSPPAVAGQQASFLITADTAGTCSITNLRINYGDNIQEDYSAASSLTAQTVTHTYKSGDTFLLSAAAYSAAGKVRTNRIYITPAPYSMPGAYNIQTHYQNEGLKFTFSLPSTNINRAVIYRNSLQLAGISPVSPDMEYLDRYLLYNTVYSYQIGVEYSAGMVLSAHITNRPFCLELAQKTIGRSGGSIGNLFSELVIPPGALPGDTLVKLVVSSNLLYNFEPGYAQAYNQVRIETDPPASFVSNARLSLLAPFLDNKIHLMPDDGNYDRIFTGSENRLTISSYNNRAWIPAYSRVYDKNILPNLNYKILTMDISDAGNYGVGIILNSTDYGNKVTVKNRVFAPLSYDIMSKVTIFFPNPFFEEVTLRIYNINGKKVFERFIGSSASMVSWDGISDSGRMSDSGLYIAVITKGGRIKDSYRVKIYMIK